MNAVRASLNTTQIDWSYWPCALPDAKDLYNQLPHAGTGMKPQEEWFQTHAPNLKTCSYSDKSDTFQSWIQKLKVKSTKKACLQDIFAGKGNPIYLLSSWIKTLDGPRQQTSTYIIPQETPRPSSRT